MHPVAGTIPQSMPTAGAEACLRQLEGLTMLDNCSDDYVSDNDDAPSLCGEEEEEEECPEEPAGMLTATRAEDSSLESEH